MPWIGNKVRIASRAKVCGPITIGDNSIIGMNAVVVKDVPANSDIVPSALLIIRKEGISTDEKF